MKYSPASIKTKLLRKVKNIHKLRYLKRHLSGYMPKKLCISMHMKINPSHLNNIRVNISLRKTSKKYRTHKERELITPLGA